MFRDEKHMLVSYRHESIVMLLFSKTLSDEEPSVSPLSSELMLSKSTLLTFFGSKSQTNSERILVAEALSVDSFSFLLTGYLWPSGCLALLHTVPSKRDWPPYITQGQSQMFAVYWKLTIRKNTPILPLHLTLEKQFLPQQHKVCFQFQASVSLEKLQLLRKWTT